MDLQKMAEAAARHRGLMIAGVLVGVVVAVVVSFRVITGSGGGPRLAPRADTIYETETQLLIFEGSYGLARAGDAPETMDAFGKTVYRAPTYAQIVLGDSVRELAEAGVGPIREVMTAEALDKSPIVVLTVSGDDRDRVVEVAQAMSDAFIRHLGEEQESYEIPEPDRVRVRVLVSPTRPKPEKNWSLELGLAAFLVPWMGALGIAVAIENRRNSRYGQGMV